MGRIFLATNSSSPISGAISSETLAAAQVLLKIRDLVLAELRSQFRKFDVLSVPDELNELQAIDWINARSQPDDVALEICTDVSRNPSIRGATVFYLAGNDQQRRGHANLLFTALLRRTPQLQEMRMPGATPDSATPIGYLPFCRQVNVPSLVMRVGFLTNSQDREIILERQRDLAIEIADGLASWSRAVGMLLTESETADAAIDIHLNGGRYGDRGILVNGNAYIPIDLADQLGIDLATAAGVRRLQHEHVVYIKAIELRDFNIAVGWDQDQQVVMLRSSSALHSNAIDRIMGHGNTSEVQLLMFLKANSEEAIAQFSDLPKLYREEAIAEGVNYDIAFAQMCLETDFLQFGNGITAKQNNFAGLGAGQPTGQERSFPSPRVGVRAHVQHLKAYASHEPLVQEIVDPRFTFVKRGVAPSVHQLSGRWSADPNYGEKIMAILRRLYESASLLNPRFSEKP